MLRPCFGNTYPLLFLRPRSAESANPMALFIVQEGVDQMLFTSTFPISQSQACQLPFKVKSWRFEHSYYIWLAGSSHLSYHLYSPSRHQIFNSLAVYQIHLPQLLLPISLYYGCSRRLPFVLKTLSGRLRGTNYAYKPRISLRKRQVASHCVWHPIVVWETGQSHHLMLITELVPPDGFGPPTLGFSVPCSTN